MKELMFLIGILSLQWQMKAQDLSWFTDLNEAKEFAAANQSNILMVFAGSDWCKPCIQFKKDILETVDFQTAISDKLVLLYLDFPARRKNKLSDEQTAYNEALAERFNKSGIFPNIILLDANENIFANPKFEQQSVAEFTGNLLMTQHN